MPFHSYKYTMSIGRSRFDQLFLLKDVISVSRLYKRNIVFLLLDQEKPFDRVEKCLVLDQLSFYIQLLCKDIYGLLKICDRTNKRRIPYFRVAVCHCYRWFFNQTHFIRSEKDIRCLNKCFSLYQRVCPHKLDKMHLSVGTEKLLLQPACPGNVLGAEKGLRCLKSIWAQTQPWSRIGKFFLENIQGRLGKKWRWIQPQLSWSRESWSSTT